MGEERFSALLLLYVHKDIEIDISKVVEMYDYTKRSNKQNVSKFSRNMFTEIRCEICINHFVEIIFTLSCADNVLEIRFIKNSFRSTMGEDRFNALLLLYVHKDIEIDISKVVEMYARQYPRRMLLYNPLSE
jgi:hypothetical protein